MLKAELTACLANAVCQPAARCLIGHSKVLPNAKLSRTYYTINFVRCKIVPMNITAGKFKGQKISVPDEKITRPTLSKVRMSVFNTLQAIMDFEGASFLDMFGGSGVMGLEALSRGFENVVAIEKHPKAAAVIKSNYKKFDNPPKLLIGDSLKLAGKLNEKFDVVYIDPPYYSGVYEESLEVVKEIAEKVVILEHVCEVDLSGWEVLKQKKYGDKFVTFLGL